MKFPANTSGRSHAVLCGQTDG